MLCFAMGQGLSIKTVAYSWVLGPAPTATRYLDVTSGIFLWKKKAGTKPTRLVLHQLGSDGAMVELPVSIDLPLPRLNTKSWDFKDFGFIIIWSFAGNIGKLHKKWFLAGRYARKDLSDVSAKLQIHICESTNAYCSQRCSLQWHLVHLCAWSAFFTWTLNLAACSHATRKVLFRIMWKLAICGYFWHLLKDTVLMLHDVWWLLVVSHILTLQTCGSPTWRTFFPSTLSKKLDSWPHNHGQMQVFLKILRRLTCRHFSYTSTQETWNPLVSDLEDIDFHQFNLRVGPFLGGRKTMLMHFVFQTTSVCIQTDVSLSVRFFLKCGSQFFQWLMSKSSHLKRFLSQGTVSNVWVFTTLSAEFNLKAPNLPGRARHDPGNLPLENSQQTRHLQSTI